MVGVSVVHELNIGQKVKLASSEQMIFIVTAVNRDGTYQIEAMGNSGYPLRYEDVPYEILKKLSD